LLNIKERKNSESKIIRIGNWIYSDLPNSWPDLFNKIIVDGIL